MILQKLYELAKYVQPVGNARIVAAVVQKGRIICIATNEKKSDPSQKRVNKWVCRCGWTKKYHNNTMSSSVCQGFNPVEEEKIYWHAETKVIKRAKKLVSGTHPKYLDGCVLYIARARKKHIIGSTDSKIVWAHGLARPCEGCWGAIAKSGITQVKWTEDE